MRRNLEGAQRVAAVLVLAAWSAAAPVVVAALEVPFLAGRVNDLANLLDSTARERMEEKLAAFERETGSQVAVLTVDSLEGDSLEDFAIRVSETWKLGREGVDDGVLLLVAQRERQLRLEVGYGLEGALPDALARRIVDNVIVPRFKDGDFAGGIEAGTDTVLAVIRGEAPPPELSDDRTNSRPGILTMLLILVYFVFVTYRGYRRLRRGGAASSWSSRGRGGGTPWIFSGGGSGRSSWGGGGGGGGFSGGGGSFGGGGASGSW